MRRGGAWRKGGRARCCAGLRRKKEAVCSRSAKKKEINIVTPGGHDVKQSAKKVYVPQSDKQTVMIDGSVDQIVDKLVEAFRNEIKVI